MKTRTGILYGLLAVVVVVAGVVVYEEKFATTAKATAAAPTVINATATATNTTTSNTTNSAQTTGAQSNNTAAYQQAHSPTSNVPANTNKGDAKMAPPTAQQVQNMKVIMDLKNSQTYYGPDNKSWAQMKEAEVGLTSNGETMIYADVLFHNATSNTIDFNSVDQTPTVALDIPKTDLPTGLEGASALNMIQVEAVAGQDKITHMPFTPDVKVAPGQTAEIKFPMYVPGVMPAANAEDPQISISLTYDGAALLVPFVDTTLLNK